MKLKTIIITLLLCSFTQAKAENLDEWGFKAINTNRHPVLSGLAAGADYSWFIAPLTWSYLLYEGLSEDSTPKLEKALWSAGGVASLVLVNQLVKVAVQRERPAFAVSEARGGYDQSSIIKIIPTEQYSFMSQAASISFFSAKYFGDEYGYKPLFYTWATLVSWARVYKGAHYPGDVIAGGVLGYALAWGTQLLHEKYKSTEKKVFLFPQKNGLMIQAQF